MTVKLKSELLTLPNVGPATFKDLHLLNIKTIKYLKDKNPDQLYEKLQHITRTKYDPCVWDVFAAIIHNLITRFVELLQLPSHGILDWFFVQSVLRWAWSLEDNVDSGYWRQFIGILNKQ